MSKDKEEPVPYFAHVLYVTGHNPIKTKRVKYKLEINPNKLLGKHPEGSHLSELIQQQGGHADLQRDQWKVAKVVGSKTPTSVKMDDLHAKASASLLNIKKEADVVNNQKKTKKANLTAAIKQWKEKQTWKNH